MTNINLRLGAHSLRLRVGDPRVAAQLVHVLANNVVDDEQPLGFVLESPSTDRGLHLLQDRCGTVLCRARSADETMSSLLGHLAAFIDPPAGTQRFRMRGLVSDSGATLCIWPLLMLEPIVEQRLVASGHAVLDRLVVDLDEHGRVVAEQPDWGLEFTQTPGHSNGLTDPLDVCAVLVPGPGAPRPSRAEVISMIAARSMGHDRSASLRGAGAAVTGATISMVEPFDRSALYRALT